MTRQHRNRVSRLFFQKPSRRQPRTYRRAVFEPLESRMVLAAPTLAAISDVTMYAGVPMYVALNGNDADSDALSFTATSSSSQLNTSIPNAENNSSLRISVAGYGDMTFQLLQELAPDVTGRIIELAQSGFYDGVTFHRIIEGFMIQGGDPTGTGYYGSGTEFDDQYNPDLRHSRDGVLSMAKSIDDTNDSQFFITNTATPGLDFNHSVFGFLTQGDSIRSEIESVATDSNDKPLTSVVMTSVDVFVDHDSGVLILKAAAGTTGPIDVTVTVSDGHGGTAQQTFHVNVVDISSVSQTDPYYQYDSAPFLGDVSPIQMKAGQQYSFNIPGHDADGDPIYYAATVVDQTSLLQVANSANTGQTVLTAASTAAGVYSLRLRDASSSSYLSLDPTVSSQYAYYNDTQLVPVYVAPQAPTVDLLASSDTGLSDGDNVTSLGNTAGKTLRFRVTGAVVGAVVSLYVDGGTTPLVQAAATGTEVILETNGALDLSDGLHQFTAVQKLQNQAVAVGNYTDTVNLVSDLSAALAVTVDTSAPQFTSAPLLTAAEGAAYAYDVQTNEEAGGQLRYTLGGSVAGMAVDDLTGQITWTPGTDQVGTQQVTVRATDLAGQYSEQHFQVTVNAAATISAIPDKLVHEGQSLGFSVLAEDDSLPLSYSLENAPAGAAIDAATGELTWSPNESHGPGEYPITVAVANSVGAIGRQTFTVTVDEVNTAPQLSGIDDYTVAEGQTLNFQAVATDADVPANQLTFHLADGAPAGAGIDAQTGQFTWTPTEADGPGEYQISVVVSDSGAATASSMFTVTVQEPSDLPAGLVDLAMVSFARQSRRSDIPARQSLPLWLQTPPAVGSPAFLNADSFRWAALDNQGLFSPRLGAQGGSHGVPQVHVPQHPIDAPEEPSESAGDTAPVDDAPAPDGKHQADGSNVDATDVAMEALSQEAQLPAAETSPAEPQPAEAAAPA